MNSQRIGLALALSILALISGCGSDAAVDLEGATVDTLVDPDFLNAGETFAVDCVVSSPSGKRLKTPTGFTVEPGKGVIVDGARVTPQYPGIYTVTCMLPDQSVKDGTPATVTVTVNNIASVSTTVEPPEVAAGGHAKVTCKVKNLGSEVVEWPTEVVVEPAEGVLVEDHDLTGNLVGQYEVACRTVDLPFTDPTPEPFSVVAGEAEAVRATIKEDEIQAGSTVPVFCTVEDAGGNVLDFPAAPDPQDGLEIDGSMLTGVVAGEYDVTCSAADLPELEQIPDHLVVVAGDVAGVRLIPSPNKPVYKVGDKVTFTLEVTDSMGNVLEGIEGTVTAPDDGVSAQGGDAWTLDQEGAFLFTGTLDPPWEALTDSVTLLCDESGPELVIDFPPRGATLDGDAGILVQGHVTDAISELKTVKLNGEEVSVEEGGFFSAPMDSLHGINILTVEAWDQHNNRSKVVQSYYFSTEWVDFEPQEMEAVRIEQGLLLFLGQDFLDDGDHDPAQVDDLATIVEILLGSVDIAGLLGGSDVPVLDTVIPGLLNWGTSIAGFDVQLTGDLAIQASIVEIVLNNPTVGIATRDGGIAMYLGFEGGGEDPGVGISLALTLGF
ncbi:MAG: hypothetical protein FJ098_15220, partial [Deltaproteobacteria bacterium]|nr:hypothetical protein [Deltaproteobacteria bacterium]